MSVLEIFASFCAAGLFLISIITSIIIYGLGDDDDDDDCHY